MTQPSTFDANEKVTFRLQRDADGYPPADWEHLWADELPGGLFRLDNTPFFARGVSFGDIVSVAAQDQMNVFQAVITPSGHSTLRVVLLATEKMTELRSRLEELGCTSELSHLPNLLAVDVPPIVPIRAVRQLLDSGERMNYWEYEEAAIRHD